MPNERPDRYLRLALIILGVLLAFLAAFLYFQYRAIRHQQFINARERWPIFFLRHSGPLAPQNADLIQPWMTFDYINHVFNLPPQYLQSQLRITDARYPKLSVGGLARDDNQTSTIDVLTQVINAVKNY